MTINDQIRDEKLLYDIYREAVKILTLSSGKTDKYEYLTGEELLPSNQQQIIEQINQQQIIEQTKFIYYPFGKAFKKQAKQLKIKENHK